WARGWASGLLVVGSMGLVERRERPSGRAHTWRRLALAVCAGSSLLILAQPAVAISPRQTLEEFFTRTNTVLQSADLTQGIEKPRNAIRNLVDETFDFRAAAAAALGPVWLARVPVEQGGVPRAFTPIV